MPSHAKRCRYCRVPLRLGVASTVDHVVPKWVLRYYSERFKRNARDRLANLVTACLACNHGKGAMPAPLFVEIRLDQPRLEFERNRWSWIAAEVRRGGRRAYLDLVYAEFGRPIPPHFPVGDKKIEIRDGEKVSRTGMFLD